MSDAPVPGWLKAQVVERAADCCEYCWSQARFAMQSFSVEHITPRSQEGDNTLDNLAWACQGCNNHKYNKTHFSDSVTGEQVRLFHPRRQRWLDHFAWNQDCTLVVGMTPTVRATVEALQMNRPGLVNLRRILAAAGEHPPQIAAPVPTGPA
jgi:hypothetical protein